MKKHIVKVYASENTPAKEDQLAWKISEVAADPVAVSDAVTDMVTNRIIDNASVAIASVNRHPVASLGPVFDCFTMVLDRFRAVLGALRCGITIHRREAGYSHFGDQ